MPIGHAPGKVAHGSAGDLTSNALLGNVTSSSDPTGKSLTNTVTGGANTAVTTTAFGAPGAGTITTVRGVHPSDREKARRSAWDKVTPQAVEAAVRDALKSTILAGD